MANLISMLDHVPVGFRFRPTDEELVDHYLKNKLLGDDFLVQIIPQIDMCNHEPWDIPALSVIKSDDEWFFFSPPQFRYSNSTRLNRATERGFWKATGKDRKIKVRGTNDVIGTKKTLVFYKGRVPNGVKTNWVIHEYHAVTFPPSQGTFVLCRLMKKPDKKAEERTDEMVYDEGEPSSLMVSDYENPATVDRVQDVSALLLGNLESNFWTPNQEDEYDLSSIQQSPITIGQEPSLQYSPFLDSYITNDNSTSHFPCETTEDEGLEEFVNSMLVDDDEGFIEERRNAFVNSNPSELSKTVYYYGSSDTDAEVVSVRYGNILDTPIVCNKNAGSRESRVMKMVRSSPGPDLTGTAQMSSNHEAKREKKDHFFQDDFWEVDSSSGDSTTAKPLKINNIEISSFPSTLRTCKTQYQPRSDNSVLQRAGTRRSQTQRKVSTKSVSHHEAQKETRNVESNKSQRKAQGTTLRNTLVAPSNQSSDTNGKGSFVHLETPSMSQNLSPRSVYLVNVVIGFSLFVVIIWELLSCGRFY